MVSPYAPSLIQACSTSAHVTTFRRNVWASPTLKACATALTPAPSPLALALDYASGRTNGCSYQYITRGSNQEGILRSGSMAFLGFTSFSDLSSIIPAYSHSTVSKAAQQKPEGRYTIVGHHTSTLIVHHRLPQADMATIKSNFLT